VRALTASEILRLWETADHLHPIDQALAVLQLVLPEQGRDGLAALPMGQRNALLMRLRSATFGDSLPGRARCPHCGESVEFELSCHDLMPGDVEPQYQYLTHDGYHLQIRPLDSFDLAAAAAQDNTELARQELLRRCVAEVLLQGESVDTTGLPEALLNRIADAALAADPRSEALLDLHCPACRHPWQSLLDIASLFWLEISARAQRLLMEVHLLASAYGWREDDILRLDPVRRAGYLQLVTA
jgi:hypothetical protein